MNSSPFHGMDPYLEAHWGDVHHRFVIYASDQIQPQLPADLRARVEERVSIESPSDGNWNVIPDVRVVERPTAKSRRRDEGGGVAVAEPEVAELAQPLLLEFQDDPITEGFIEIVEAGSRQKVITVIEVLSETNKRSGKDRKKYLRKRKQLRRARINLVEIDLLRSGRRLPPLDAYGLPDSHQTPYCVLTMRARQEPLEYYRVPLRERLPKVPIPLRTTDKDVVLDLQALFDLSYANGRYDDIDYTREPNPPLEPDDAAWADRLLREKRLRKVV
ncbi:MAG TPA: DUF4058 family protein [Planctomycetaceae bacterium]|nr:DUF4058 family protein [Planctomycetaceae bacterium]